MMTLLLRRVPAGITAFIHVVRVALRHLIMTSIAKQFTDP